MQKLQLAQLQAITLQNANAKEAIVFLHGYGANKEDLAPLASFLEIGRPLNYYFLDAPNEIPIGFGMIGRAWFQLDYQKLDEAMRCGDFSKFAEHVPEGLYQSASLVEVALAEISNKYEKLYLAGFSQGSMISAQVSLSNPGLANKLVLLSSTFINEKKWTELVESAEKLPIFQSHGVADQVLPFNEAKRLSEFFKAKGFSNQFVEFPGGHEIPPQVLQQLGNFLREEGQS